MTTERFSVATNGAVIHLHQRDPKEALERLNRITGLHFASWPESLVPHLPKPQAEPLTEQPEQPEQPECAAQVGI